jgi:hydroxymethylpyrimidine/phosphomethylpyrimidine kinase
MLSEINLKEFGSDIIDLIIRSPFISELKQGTLPQSKFEFFMLQDMLYLKEYGPINGMIADLITDKDAHDYFVDGKASSEQEVKFLEEKYKKKIPGLEQTPSNLLYTSYLYKNIYEKKLEKSLCACFACPWVYFKVGAYLKANTDKSNPYRYWIEFYSQDDYEKKINFYLNYTNSLLEKLSNNDRDEAIKAFYKCCEMEYLFWDSAYKSEKWPGDDVTIVEIKSNPPVVITIAGSDSSGGAGIQSDMNTFHSMKVFGTTVITALTAQNSIGVQNVFPVDSNFVINQLESVFSDFKLDGVKLGMLYDENIILKVADYLKKRKQDYDFPIVVDPVMISTSGHILLKENAVIALSSKLFPIADLITPNLDETYKLLSIIPDNMMTYIETINEMVYAAKTLSSYYNIRACLIKGGHIKIDGKAIDVLYQRNTDIYTVFENKYLNSSNTHGTGCSLSSAITALLARKCDLITSIRKAKDYVHDSISKGFRLGKGENGTLNHIR